MLPGLFKCIDLKRFNHCKVCGKLTLKGTKLGKYCRKCYNESRRSNTKRNRLINNNNKACDNCWKVLPLEAFISARHGTCRACVNAKARGPLVAIRVKLNSINFRTLLNGENVDS